MAWSQPGAFHPGQQGHHPGLPQLPPGLSLASLHSRGCVPTASPATGLNQPLGPPSAQDRVAPATLRTTLPRQNKLDPVAASCPCVNPSVGGQWWPRLCQGQAHSSPEDTVGARQAGGQASCGHSVSPLGGLAPGQGTSGLHPALACGLGARSCRVTWQATLSGQRRAAPRWWLRLETVLSGSCLSCSLWPSPAYPLMVSLWWSARGALLWDDQFLVPWDSEQEVLS